jgi:hypothetical protein
MKARAWITTALGAAGVLTAGLLVHRAAHSADHLDSPAVVADPTIDINDVYTWMDPNSGDMVIAATLYPVATPTTLFSDTAQYVLHTTSGAAYGATNVKYDIICTFAGTTAPQTISCWGGTNEFVTGNANASAGITSADGKMKVFAGPRSDPFHFNLAGFHAVVSDVEEQVEAGAVAFNDAGCALLTAGQSTLLLGQLGTAPDGGVAADYFATLDALAIVVSIDKSLVTTGGSIVSVWAGTYK